jgi:hypothetical protein
MTENRPEALYNRPIIREVSAVINTVKFIKDTSKASGTSMLDIYNQIGKGVKHWDSKGWVLRALTHEIQSEGVVDNEKYATNTHAALSKNLGNFGATIGHLNRDDAPASLAKVSQQMAIGEITPISSVRVNKEVVAKPIQTDSLEITESGPAIAFTTKGSGKPLTDRRLVTTTMKAVPAK